MVLICINTFYKDKSQSLLKFGEKYKVSDVFLTDDNKVRLQLEGHKGFYEPFRFTFNKENIDLNNSDSIMTLLFPDDILFDHVKIYNELKKLLNEL